MTLLAISGYVQLKQYRALANNWLQDSSMIKCCVPAPAIPLVGLHARIQKFALCLFSVYTNDRKQGKRNLIKEIHGCTQVLNISVLSRDRKGKPGLIGAKCLRPSCSGLYVEGCQDRTKNIQHIF